MRLIYVAGPYTGATDWIVAQNIRAAEAYGREVALLGLFPIVPHVLGMNFGDEQTPEFWYEGTLEVMRRCDAVIMLPTWKSSKGAIEERRVALELNLPVFESLEALRVAFGPPYTCARCHDLGQLRRWDASDESRLIPCPECKP